jgi:peptide/nickel transport system permease protein
MYSYLARNIRNVTLTLLVVSFGVFVLNEFSPGDVARKILGPYASDEQVRLMTEQLGLNRPLLLRYLEYLGDVVTGQLGESQVFRQPVIQVIAERLSNTAVLTAICCLLIIPLSILGGALAGMREGSRLDRSITLVSTIGTSIPEFALGVFLLSIFSVWLGILPGTSPLRPEGTWPVWTQFVLPALVVTIFYSGYLISMIRGSMVDVMRRPFIRTAILKGLPFRQVVINHALRNALITPFTIILLQINYLISGLVVVETIFAFPGFGRMMLDAALNKDIALLEAGTLFAVAVTMITQILGDVGYAWLNPKLRVGN